jgi:hypothetical protein
MNTRPVTLAGLLLLAILVAACSASAAPPAATAQPAPPTDAPRDLPITGGGGGAVGDPGGVVPEPGQPTLVVVKPGVQNPRAVNVAGLQSKVVEGRVTVRASWWSGIEPCYSLESVKVKQEGTTITLVVNEGTGLGDVACIDIAVYKATDIDLGKLPSGTYTVKSDQGDGIAIQVVVP